MDLSANCLSDGILPKSTKNIGRSVLTPFKGCKVLEGKFKIDAKAWDTIFDGSKLVLQYYPYYLKNRIQRYVNNTCLLKINYVKYHKNNIKLYATCKHKLCKRFKIIVQNRSVFVYSSSMDYCHRTKITSYVKGVERNIVKSKLMNMKPSTYKRQCILQTKTVNALSGNLYSIKSDSTIRKIKQEAVSTWDRCGGDDVIDMMYMYNDHKEYIQEVAVPFKVKLYSHEQVKLAEQQKLDSAPTILYFDATGGVVRRPVKESQKIYLYSGVIRIQQTKRTCSVFDMISSEHHAKAIFSILNDFRTMCEEKDKWPMFSAVVTDFSFANLHALSKAFNRKTLQEYLDVCYNIVTEKSSIPQNFISIHLCCAHYMKMVSKDVDSAFSDIKQRIFLKELVAKCIIMSDIVDINAWFYNLSTLLSSPYENDTVRQSYNNLINIGKSTEDNDDIQETFKFIFSKPDSDKANTLYRNSPFYKHFFNLPVPEITSVGEDVNIYYNVKFLDTILNKYLPYCPLWSALLLKRTCNKQRVSNSPVENYFGHMKNNVLNNKRNLKCSRFVRKLREHVLSVYKELQLGIQKSGLCKKQKRISSYIQNAESEYTSQEQWQKRARSSQTHFMGRFMKQLKSSQVNLVKDDSIEDFLKCIYCGKGRLSQEVAWIQCD